jgi:ABC-type polar amino acid transport system ATPase subunit
MAGTPLVVVERVNKWFDDLHVLQDVDLEVGRGEVVVIVGPSGSGKSTLCRCINRLERIDSQQQRAAIARALAMEPKLMMFDEPTSALDPEMIQEVLEVMEELAGEGTTMLVVSHEMGFARSAANRVAFMDGGRILETAPPDQFFDHPQTDRAKEFLSKILVHQEKP